MRNILAHFSRDDVFQRVNELILIAICHENVERQIHEVILRCVQSFEDRKFLFGEVLCSLFLQVVAQLVSVRRWAVRSELVDDVVVNLDWTVLDFVVQQTTDGEDKRLPELL